MASNDNSNIEGAPFLGEIPIGAVAELYSSVAAGFRRFDAVGMAAKFAGLLALPELQANCFRLEALVHIAIAYSKGAVEPSDADVRSSFDALSHGYCGRMEDPAEDVFVALVNSQAGNYRIFQGLRESPTFYLQRILNVVDTMPDLGPFKNIRESTEAILKLSEALAERLDIRENSVGTEQPLDELPVELIPRVTAASSSVSFSEEDLRMLKISKESLQSFVFNLDLCDVLSPQMMGNSDLERRPIVEAHGLHYLLLPTAVSSAITRLVIESLSLAQKGDLFEEVLAHEYAKLLYQTPILGKRLARPPVFKNIGAGGIASSMMEVDPGRFLHLVFFLDSVNGFLEDGFGGINADPAALSGRLAEEIVLASSQASKTDGFQGGLTLLVHCGYGRSFVVPFDESLPNLWRLQFLGAPDLNTLNWVHGFDALSLWRLLDAREVVETQGTHLLNVNGLLNLAAWSLRLKGHLVPHGHLPTQFGESGAPNLVAIQQNALLKLRHEVLLQWNPRRVRDSNGNWVRVRKFNVSSFEDDRTSPLYASEDDVHEDKLRAVYVTPRRSWWIDIVDPDLTSREAVFQYWTMLAVWLKRSAPILDDAYESLPKLPFSIRVFFEEIVWVTHGEPTPKSDTELRGLLKISTDASTNTVNIVVGKGYYEGFFQPENVGERVLVEAFVKAAAILAQENNDKSKSDELVRRICPSTYARQIHMFRARSFRDYVGSGMGDSPTLIDSIDDAAFRVGLGWKARARSSGSEILGVNDCTAYLNKVVKVILDELTQLLQQLDRSSFVMDLLRNYESAAHDRDVWKRSAQAVLALHDDTAATTQVILEHQGSLNACFTASRILLEAAICECPGKAGRIPGQIDLSRAMALAMLGHAYGSWSDAIYWGALEPFIKITPLGDVYVKHDFMDTVYDPFGRAVGEAMIQDDATSYSQLYQPIVAVSSVSSLFEQRFNEAWQDEYKVSVDGMLAFARKLADVENQPIMAVQNFRRSALITLLAEAAQLSEADAGYCLDSLTSQPRAHWRIAGLGFVDKDWFPWRFRRRLSILRKPFVAIDSGPDASIVVAPGLIVDAFQALIRSFHSGEVPPWQIKSNEMLRWIGHANHTHRTAFNQKVAERMRELGWEAEPEVKVTGILRRSLDRNYGDVDVVAWNRSSGRVLAMECKDLQFNKTLGEVAEQLSDFRGATKAGGKRDSLKRHLDRLEILEGYHDAVSKTLKLLVTARIEGHLVFKNPVPMRFAWERMESRTKVSLFKELDRL